jgi:GT2 family glycosyltransferase
VSPEVDICILCHNRQDVTARFLVHLAGHLEGVRAKIWLLDNNSTDGTWTLLKWFKSNTRRWWPWARYKGLNVKICRSPENLGFAGGNNFIAQNCRAKYICFLNNDVFPEDGWWLHLLLFGMRTPKWGAKGPISDNVMGIQHKVWNEKFDWARAAGGAGQIHRAQCLSGFCWLMRRKVFEEIGEWDEQFFNGDEDLDLSIRLRRAGYLLMVDRNVFVQHECSQSMVPWCALRGETVEGHFEKTRMLLLEKYGRQCENDIGFWEHIDRPRSEWRAMGVLPNGEYFSPPGGRTDQVRAIAENALSAGGQSGVLPARELYTPAPPKGDSAYDPRIAESQLYPHDPEGDWSYHVGTGAGDSFVYAGVPEEEDCPLESCAICGTAC